MWEVRGGWGGLLILPSPLYDPIHPHSDHCLHAFIHTLSTNCATSSMPLLGRTLSFSGCVNPPLPPTHHLLDNDNILPYILSLYIFNFLSLYPQILVLPHILVSW